MARRRPRGGMLAWLALLGLLLAGAAVLVPNFIRARSRGQLTACKSNLKNIGTAMEMYSTDWSGHYPSQAHSLTPNYLKTIPDCPGAGKDTYSATLRLLKTPYMVVICEKHHREDGACKDKREELFPTIREFYDQKQMLPKGWADLEVGEEQLSCPDGGPPFKLEERESTSYHVHCEGENHKWVSVARNYPQYNGTVGLLER